MSRKQTNAQRESFWARVDFDMGLHGLTNDALCARLLDAELGTDNDEHAGLIGEARRRLLVWTATPAEIDAQEEAQVNAIVAAMTTGEHAETNAMCDRAMEYARRKIEEERTP